MRPVTENARYGATRNPWNPELSAGGSSGGSASAVASRMVALADASDLGGSIRIPASCCGLVGLKPSLGRVSIGPDFGDLGGGMPVDCVLTRTVLDTAVALDAIAGYEPGDRHHAPAPPASFADAARSSPARLRVRLCLSAPFGIPVDAEPAAAARAAADALAALGHDVGEWTPPWDDEAFPSSWATFMTGTGQHLVRVIERLHGQPVDAAQLEPATRAWLLDAPPMPLVDHLEAAERLWAFGRRMQDGWAPDEILLTPTLTRLPAPVGGIKSQAGVTDDASRFSALVRIWNVTGQPAISLPLSQTGGRRAGGRPARRRARPGPSPPERRRAARGRRRMEAGRAAHGVALPDINQEAGMSLARVVSFDGVTAERIEALRKEIGEGGRPEEIPATEILVLHDAEGERSLTIVFFDSEDDYARGDAALNAMSPPETPGKRTGVEKYEVAIRMTT